MEGIFQRFIGKLNKSILDFSAPAIGKAWLSDGSQDLSSLQPLILAVRPRTAERRIARRFLKRFLHLPGRRVRPPATSKHTRTGGRWFT